MDSERPKPSYFAFIPANVRYADIEPNAKLLYGEITALCQTEGFCWATNEYFADLYGVKIRAVQNWLKSLKDLGVIKIENPSNLEKTSTRKIWLCLDCKKMFTERKKMQGGVQKNASTPIYNNTTSNIPPISPTGGVSIPPKKRTKKQETLMQKKPYVWVTPSQHEHLLRKANHDESLLDSWYERLEIWKVQKGLEGGNDFGHLTDWVPGAVEQDKNKIRPTTINAGKVDARKKWAQENEKNYTSQAGSAFAGEDAFIINSGATMMSYKYKEDSLFWKEKGL